LVKQSESGDVNYYSLEKDEYGVVTLYVTRGNNVIYEKSFSDPYFDCPTTCQYDVPQGSPKKDIFKVIKDMLFSQTESSDEKMPSKLSTLFGNKEDK